VEKPRRLPFAFLLLSRVVIEILPQRSPLRQRLLLLLLVLLLLLLLPLAPLGELRTQ
jgi:hypothetical protein